MLCLPDLDTKSLQHTDGAVTANANEAARSIVGLDPFHRAIVNSPNAPTSFRKVILQDWQQRDESDEPKW
jgi:hypothetical protein